MRTERKKSVKKETMLNTMIITLNKAKIFPFTEVTF